MNAAWAIACIVVFWSFGYTIMRGSDLWWHIAGGRWMVEHGTVFVREPFSFTAEGRWWINDAWLSDVLLYLWSEAFGVESLAYWKWALIVLTWAVVFRFLARICGERIVAFVVATFGLALAAPFLDVRPQLYSFLGFAVLLDVCWGRPPPRWLPLLFLVWVNLHAGFLIGLIVLPFLLLVPLAAEPASWRRLLLLGGACVLVCGINPSGPEVVLRPLRYAFDSSSPFRLLGEWLPAFVPGGIRSWLLPYAMGIFAAAVVAAVIDQVWIVDKRRAEVWLAIAIGALTLLMALRSRRFVPFFAIAYAPVVAYVVARLLGAQLRRVPPLVAPVFATAIGLYWLLPFPQSSYAFEFLTARYEFPVETSNFIERNRLSGKVFNYYNWGGYLHLRHNGAMKVFIDGRSETAYDDQTFVDYLTVLHQKPGWKEVVDASGAEWVLWPHDKGRVAYDLNVSGDWDLVYRDYKSALLRRADAPPLPPVEMTDDSAYRRLASGWFIFTERRFAEAQIEFERALEFAPHMQTACINLARTQVYAGADDDAARTMERCNEIFPQKETVKWFAGFAESVKMQREKTP